MDTISLVVLNENNSEEIYNKLIKYENKFDALVCIYQNRKYNIQERKNIKFYQKKFEGDFSNLRNFALEKITTEWVFFLDSDEEIDKELLSTLPSLLNDSAIDGYWIRRKTYIDSNKYLRYGLFYPDYQLRLFRVLPKYKFLGKIHETVNIPKQKTKEILFDILHHPNLPKYSKFSDVVNMVAYAKTESIDIRNNNWGWSKLLLIGIWKSISVFLSGFVRGKGFLDGWAGFRAHFIFSEYLLLKYIYAAKA